MSVKDDLAGVLADSLNKKFKDYKVAYFLDGAQETPTDIKEFISTGSTMLDLAISNRPNGGIAVGRITELNGLESSGKSLVGAHLLAETQKKGGVAVYIDTETAVSEEFLGVIGEVFMSIPSILLAINCSTSLPTQKCLKMSRLASGLTNFFNPHARIL